MEKISEETTREVRELQEHDEAMRRAEWAKNFKTITLTIDQLDCLIEALWSVTDEGPASAGWKSRKLSDLIHLLEEQKNKQ